MREARDNEDVIRSRVYDRINGLWFRRGAFWMVIVDDLSNCVGFVEQKRGSKLIGMLIRGIE